MSFRELKIAGAYEFTPRQFGDDRGVFFEWFKSTAFEEAIGRPLELQQANCSVLVAGPVAGGAHALAGARAPSGQGCEEVSNHGDHAAHS